jgi:hypothetical protein
MEDILSSNVHTIKQGDGLFFERFIPENLDVGGNLELEHLLRKSDVGFDLRELKFGFIAGPVKKNGLEDKQVSLVDLEENVRIIAFFSGSQFQLPRLRILRGKRVEFDLIIISQFLLAGEEREDFGFILFLGQRALNELFVFRVIGEKDSALIKKNLRLWAAVLPSHQVRLLKIEFSFFPQRSREGRRIVDLLKIGLDGAKPVKLRFNLESDLLGCLGKTVARDEEEKDDALHGERIIAYQSLKMNFF